MARNLPKFARRFGPGRRFRLFGRLRGSKRAADKTARGLRRRGWNVRVVPFKFFGRGETEYAVYRRAAAFTKAGKRRRRRR